MRFSPAIAALLAFFWTQPAAGYEKLITRHSKAAQIPPNLAIAIAKQESSLNPLCINIEGKDFSPASRTEAESLIEKAAKADLSYDVGIMQINSQWIKKLKLDPISLLDADANIRLGLRILKDEIKRHGANWRAVGAYHSPNPARAMQYANQVFGRMRGRSDLIGPRLQILVDKGIITRAEAKSILANPRLQGQHRRKSLKALRQRLALRDARKKSKSRN